MSEFDLLEESFDTWEDFEYDTMMQVTSGFQDFDLVTENTQEARSYKAWIDDEKFNFSVEYGEVDGREGYAFSADPNGEAAEYLQEIAFRLSDDVEEIADGEYFTRRTR